MWRVLGATFALGVWAVAFDALSEVHPFAGAGLLLATMFAIAFVADRFDDRYMIIRRPLRRREVSS